MATPTRGDWQRLKRLGRYLSGKPRMEQLYKWQEPQSTIKVFTDADWAGCRETRKSTIGGCAMLGAHTVKGWSKTQSLIALSSCESELYAALKASADALGLVALLQDLGYIVKGEIWGDASAALGIINRKGLGKKTRHIDIGLLWIQQTVADQRLKYAKVLGKDNPADLFTKFLDAATSNTHVKRLEYQFTHGRSIEAPQLQTVGQSIDECRHGHEYGYCDWVQAMINSLSMSKYKEPRRTQHGGLNNLVWSIGNVHRGRRQDNESVNSKDQCMCNSRNAECGKDTTNVWQQVLWGYTQRVQGSTGSNAAQFSCPQSPTLTFRHNAGVSWVNGLRHGVTMHPRGRHLSKGMTLLPHGLTHHTACEQQPTQLLGLPNSQPLGLHNPQPLGSTTRGRTWKSRYRAIKFPRRDVSQRSSTANPGNKFGERSHATRPIVYLLWGPRESWLSP